MKRVCTFRKVLFSVSKVLLEKLFFIVLKYRGFYHHSVLIVLKYCGFLLPLSSYRLRNISSREICHGIATLNICIRKSFFSQFYYHICHTHTNLLVYSSLMMVIPPVFIATLLPPIATHKVTDFAIIMPKICVISWYSVISFALYFFSVHWGSWCIDWTKRCFFRSIQPFFRLFITKNGSEAYVMFK